MYLLVLVIRLFTGLISGLIRACAQMAVSGAVLAGVLVQDDRRVRARRAASPAGEPMPTSHKWAAGFFLVVFALLAYGLIFR